LITCDTSALLTLFNRRDRDYARVRAAAENVGSPYIVPAATLGEVGHFIEARMTLRVLDAFLADLETGRFTLDAGTTDFERVRHLVQRYADLSLGLVDAAVIACAERHGGLVPTLDRRHFDVVAGEGTIAILP
jgi:predicted nucleic acid-binding protein